MQKTQAKFAFHKHLVVMQCRKDIILENDFINQRIKNKTVSFMHKYNTKIKNNKMRVAYLAGFSVCFSLGIIYDLFFESNVYYRLSSFVFDRSYLPALKELQTPSVNYRLPQAKAIGQYFIQMELKYPHQQIKSSWMANRIPDLAEENDSVLDVNSFVSKCLSRGIKADNLPQL